MRDSSHYLFYTERVDGDRVRLSADEARHAVRVLRLSPGATMQATDGAGIVYRCRLLTADTTGAECEVLATSRRERPPPRITLYAGLPDRDAFERLIDQIVPLGVGSLVPLVSARSQHRWWHPKWNKHRERFRRKMIVAMKQALHPFLPELAPPVSFDDVMGAVQGPAVLADDEGQSPHELDSSLFSTETVSVIVGPPGGFAPEELRLLRDYPALPVRLSPNRLRTELAAVLLCGILLAH